MTEQRKGGLEAMYMLAAVLMGLAALVIALLAFVPSSWFDEPSSGEAYTPGSQPKFERLGPPGVELGTPGLSMIFTGRYQLNLTGYNWGFDPAEVRVPLGSEVTIRAWSTADFHGVAIAGTDVVLSMEKNKAAEAVYIFDKPGEYLFVCSEFCGAGHVSMMGKIIVE